ncbi:MAG: hypothetical protein ACTSW4_05380 [Candidatus Ranarchaeia archaeon]
MTRKWFHIAKVEFLVSTSSLKGRRRFWMGIFITLGIIWAGYIAPLLIGWIIEAIIPFYLIQLILIGMLPGFMRSIVMFLWVILLIMPMSYALQEIKIGQWEILLSNNVRTRDILTGSFLGKIPLYGLIVLFLAPVIISPFALAFEVTVIGQVLIYGILIFTVLSTIWLSNFITVAIQSRLGDSSRGNDIAKALAFVLALVTILPMYGIMMFAPLWAEILGASIFMFLPFTWSADLISWIIISFNGIQLTSFELQLFQTVLYLDLSLNLLLVGGFSLLTIGIGLLTADRLFTITAGARTEIITTVGRDNLIYRGIQRLFPSSFGTLITVGLKDFFRKAQNLSKIVDGAKAL